MHICIHLLLTRARQGRAAEQDAQGSGWRTILAGSGARCRAASAAYASSGCCSELAPNTHGASVEKKAHKTKCVNHCPHRPIPLRNVYGYPRAEPLRTFFQLIWGKIP